jgi:4-carboxymuconolactone decarboxylase
MSDLEMDPAKFPAPVKALYERIATRRRAKGEGFGGPYLALLNHPALAERVEALGFYLKFEGVLPRVHYQFIVLSVARATGAAFEWQDHVQHALAAGLPQNIIDGIAEVAAASLPHPYGLLREILSKTLAWQPIPRCVAGTSRRRMGQGRPGRDRGGFRLLSDVRGDQSGFRYCVAEVSGGRCRATENLSAYRFARASRVQYFFCGRNRESMPIMKHIGW